MWVATSILSQTFDLSPISWILTLVLLVANLVNTKWCEKSWKFTETLAKGYSSDCTHQELPSAYQHSRVQKVFKIFCIFVLFTKKASASKGLSWYKCRMPILWDFWFVRLGSTFISKLKSYHKQDRNLRLWSNSHLFTTSKYISVANTPQTALEITAHSHSNQAKPLMGIQILFEIS